MSEAMRLQTGRAPAWLLFSGVAIGVVGASVKKHAESVSELVVALSGPTENSDVAIAVALDQSGLLLLVVGPVALLAGPVVIALAGRRMRRRAMDARRCSVACGCGTSAPSLRSKAEPAGRRGQSFGNGDDAGPGALLRALAFDSNQTSRPTLL